MKYCKRCKIQTSDEQLSCPLCYNELEKINDENITSFYPKRKEDEKLKHSEYFLTKLFTVISICIVATCIFINVLTFTGSVWSLLIAACVVYLWILIAHTIISKSSVFEKIMYQIIGLTAVLTSTDVISGGGDWLINFVVPSLSITLTLVLVMISFCSSKRNRYALSFFLIYLLLIIVPIVTLAFKIVRFKLIMQINLFILILVIIGTLIFGGKTIKNEISRKFHL